MKQRQVAILCCENNLKWKAWTEIRYSGAGEGERTWFDSVQPMAKPEVWAQKRTERGAYGGNLKSFWKVGLWALCNDKSILAMNTMAPGV